MLAHLLLSVLGGFGLAVALVEKKRDWPIRRYHILLQRTLHRINTRAAKMLDCTVCTSFWATLVIEIVMLVGKIIGHGNIYWFWPISGFVTLGFTWFVIQFLDAIDPK